MILRTYECYSWLGLPSKMCCTFSICNKAAEHGVVNSFISFTYLHPTSSRPHLLWWYLHILNVSRSAFFKLWWDEMGESPVCQTLLPCPPLRTEHGWKYSKGAKPSLSLSLHRLNLTKLWERKSLWSQPRRGFRYSFMQPPFSTHWLPANKFPVSSSSLSNSSLSVQSISSNTHFFLLVLQVELNLKLLSSSSYHLWLDFDFLLPDFSPCW